LHDLPLTPRLIFSGDFNTFLQAKEKLQGTIVQDPSREYMEDLISVFDMADVKPKKCKYTWSNKRMGKDHIATRLDIFLVNNIFLEDILWKLMAPFPSDLIRSGPRTPPS
jgi:hypothetical protein